MPITILDGIVLGVALFSAILAMVRGFSREVLSVASWVGAAAAAYFLYPHLLPYASQYTTSGTVAMIGSAAGLPVLIEALGQSGYSEPLLKKLGSTNWLNVLERTIG